MIIPVDLKGESIENGKVIKKYSTIDTDTLDYCWRHNIYLTSDWRNPSPEDQKKLNKIRLKEGTTTDKDGTVRKYRFCIKCFQTVYYTREP